MATSDKESMPEPARLERQTNASRVSTFPSRCSRKSRRRRPVSTVRSPGSFNGPGRSRGWRSRSSRASTTSRAPTTTRGADLGAPTDRTSISGLPTTFPPPRLSDEPPSFARGVDGTRLFVRTQRAGGQRAGRPRDSQRRHPVRRLHLEVLLGRPCARSSRSCTGTTGATGAARRPPIPSGSTSPRTPTTSARVRRHVGDPPCVLVGHSMGCQVALEAYRQRPEGCAAWSCSAGASATSPSTFHGVPVPRARASEAARRRRRCRRSRAPSGAACLRGSR